MRHPGAEGAESAEGAEGFWGFGVWGLRLWGVEEVGGFTGLGVVQDLGQGVWG